jgi:polyphenol oxidase
MFFNSQPEDLRAAIGPGIRSCCYRIGGEVEEEFQSQFTYASKLIVKRNDPPSPLRERYPRMFITYKSPEYKDFHEPDEETRQIYLDLVLANVTQLMNAGVRRNHLYSEAPCTSCHPELSFSHRRDAGRTGRMMGVIGIRDKQE